MKEVRRTLMLAKKYGIYPDEKAIFGPPTSTEVTIGNKKILVFCSNDYLGLANNPALKTAAHRAIDKYGIGSGGSRLISGTTDIQIELERAIAEFKGTEAAVTFSTGYMANIGTVPAVIDAVVDNIEKRGDKIIISPSSKQNAIFSDKYNHASIIDGCRLSRAKFVIYKHKNVKDLEAKLNNYKNYRKLIVTDSIFSMDGDIAPLPDIISLARKHKAMVMADDAHASGVLGKNGRGITEYFGLKASDLDIIMGTFTKAFGGVGGFIAGNSGLVDFLRITAHSYIFSAPIPPLICASLIAAIKEVKYNTALRENLWKNVDYLKAGLKKIGYNMLSSQTQIIPVLIGNEKECIRFSRLLFEKGILVPCVQWPAVPWGKARLRIIVKASHTKEQIDFFIGAMKEVGRKFKIL